jgi:hypothetical protein
MRRTPQPNYNLWGDLRVVHGGPWMVQPPSWVCAECGAVVADVDLHYAALHPEWRP